MAKEEKMMRDFLIQKIQVNQTGNIGKSVFIDFVNLCRFLIPPSDGRLQIGHIKKDELIKLIYNYTDINQPQQQMIKRLKRIHQHKVINQRVSNLKGYPKKECPNQIMKAKKLFQKAPIDKSKQTNEIINLLLQSRGLLNNAINDSINAIDQRSNPPP